MAHEITLSVVSHGQTDLVNQLLHDLRRPLKKGDRFPMTLSFERAGEVKVEIVVEEAAPAAAKAAGHNH